MSPVEQALPLSAALAEPKGALRYHGPDTGRPGEMVRIRRLARLGTDVRIGTGLSITVAATASAQVPQPGGVLTIEPGSTGPGRERGVARPRCPPGRPGPPRHPGRRPPRTAGAGGEAPSRRVETGSEASP
jgi:hypothetical protein